jgi:AcrR family transcriptional regulator
MWDHLMTVNLKTGAETGIFDQVILRIPLKMTKDTQKKKRTRNPLKTRAKLLQATIDLVGEKGAEALSLKEAALRANVSRGAAYMHFDDRDQLLSEAQTWISERLQEGVKRFDRSASMHDRILYTTKLVLEHPEASKLMITAALAGKDLDPQHPLYKLVSKMLKQHTASGIARAGIDLEIMTYIQLGSIATTIMLGEQHRGGDLNELAERFTNEWIRILRGGIFAQTAPHKPRNRVASRKSRAVSPT